MYHKYYAHASTHIFAHVQYIQTYSVYHTCTHTHTCMYVCTHHACMHTHALAHMHAHTAYACMHLDGHTYTPHMHTHTPEQDLGLDALSKALRRQQEVGLAIQEEVTEHNGEEHTPSSCLGGEENPDI